MIDSRLLPCKGQPEIEENFDRSMSLNGIINRKTFYVDSNQLVDTGDGLSWATAFKKLSTALAASHADIAADSGGWAGRNRIYFKGDQTATADGEDLTKLAQKTDVIGVGSTDWKSKPQLIGNHVVPATISYMGCRFINVMFKGPIASGGDILTLTGQHGIEFIECEAMGDSTIAATAWIVADGCVGLKAKKCVSKGAFSDAVIELGAGQADDFEVDKCFLQGANEGVMVAAGATFAAGKYGVIKNTTTNTTLAGINDASNKIITENNNIITLAAKGVAMAGAIVCNIKLSQGNLCTTSDANNVVYPANGAI